MIDLDPFCSTGRDPRDYLRTPIRLDSHIVASNGHVLIAVPDDGRELPANASSYPQRLIDVVARMLGLAPGAVTFRAADVALPEGKDCKPCNGTGKAKSVRCPECDDGEFEHGTHTYECKDCDGNGDTLIPDEGSDCDKCRGSGRDLSKAVPLGPCHLRHEYLAALQNLPNCEIAPINATEAVPFSFDGGRGVVMPVRVKS